MCIDPWVQTALLCLLSLLLVGCGGAVEQAPEELRIGLVIQTAHLEGREAVQAARLAVEQVNAVGGLLTASGRIPVRLVERTDHLTPQQATAAARELIFREHVAVVIGPFLSRDAIPVADVAEEAQVPMISPGSTHPLTTAGKQWVFRVPFVDTVQGQALATFAVEEIGRTAAVLYDVTDAFSRDIAEIFRETFTAAGGQVMVFETFTLQDTDFEPQLELIRDQQPEVLFLPSTNKLLKVQARQARQLGIESVILGCDSWSVSKLVDIEELDGSFALQHWHPGLAATVPEARAFLDAYRGAFKEEPADMTALAWDAFQLIFEVAAAGLDAESIRDGLASMEGFRGASGEITFAGRGGNPARPAMIIKIAGGQTVLQQQIRP